MQTRHFTHPADKTRSSELATGILYQAKFDNTQNTRLFWNLRFGFQYYPEVRV